MPGVRVRKSPMFSAVSRSESGSIPPSVFSKYRSGHYGTYSFPVYGTSVSVVYGMLKGGGYYYEIIEPEFNDYERDIYNNVVLKNRAMLELLLSASPAGMRDIISSFLEKEGVDAGDITREKIIYRVQKDILGLGDVDILLSDPLVEDISVSGANRPFFVFISDSRESNYYATGITLDREALGTLIMRLTQMSNRYVSIISPVADGTFTVGKVPNRLSAVYGNEIDPFGGAVSIRRVRENPISIASMVASGVITEEVAAYLWMLVSYGISGMVCGGVGAGKTTALNAILSFIPADKKVISIEDTRELNLMHENWLQSVTRKAENRGDLTVEYTMDALLKSALRERPDYIVVGEVRGEEAYNLFQAMSTGHAVYGTFHSGSIDDMYIRLTKPPLNVPPSLINALGFVMFIGFVDVGQGERIYSRKLLNLYENSPVGYRDETEPKSEPVFRRDRINGGGLYSWSQREGEIVKQMDSELLKLLMEKYGMSEADMERELEGRMVAIRYVSRVMGGDYRAMHSIADKYWKVKNRQSLVDGWRRELDAL